MLNANQNPHTWLALEDRAPTRLRLSEFFSSQIADIWQTILVIWENRLNWSNLRLNEFSALEDWIITKYHSFTQISQICMSVIIRRLGRTNLNGTQIYNSDKLEMIQRMHRLRAISLVWTQILLRQIPVDSDFTRTIWAKTCRVGALLEGNENRKWKFNSWDVLI